MKIEKHGVIHAGAFCKNCDFKEYLDISNINSLPNLRAKSKRHVTKTGHSIILEVGTSYSYSA